MIRNLLWNTQLDIVLSDNGYLPPTWNKNNLTLKIAKLYYIKEGLVTIESNNDKRIFNKHTLILIKDNLCHSYYKDPSCMTFKYWVHFTLTNGVSSVFENLDYNMSIKVDNPDLIEKQFRKIDKYHGIDSLEAVMEEKSSLYALLSLFFKNNSSLKIIKHNSNTQFDSILDYLKSNLSSKLTLNETAQKFSYHPNYLSRLCKKQTGLSYKRYVHLIKLDYAKNLLVSTQLTIEEITNRIGFQTPSYFSRCFKERFGLTPSEFKKSRIDMRL